MDLLGKPKLVSLRRPSGHLYGAVDHIRDEGDDRYKQDAEPEEWCCVDKLGHSGHVWRKLDADRPDVGVGDEESEPGS